jgi:DoxX-like family
MSERLEVASRPKWMLWTGWILSLLPVPMMVMGAMMSIRMPPEIEANFKAMGWEKDVALTIVVLNLGSLVLYLIPQTAMLGAILLTGYFGGAVATHLRVGETGKCWIPVAFGVVVWLGLFFRDARVRSLIPIRKL